MPQLFFSSYLVMGRRLYGNNLNKKHTFERTLLLLFFFTSGEHHIAVCKLQNSDVPLAASNVPFKSSLSVRGKKNGV